MREAWPLSVSSPLSEKVAEVPSNGQAFLAIERMIATTQDFARSKAGRRLGALLGGFAGLSGLGLKGQQHLAHLEVIETMQSTNVFLSSVEARNKELAAQSQPDWFDPSLADPASRLEAHHATDWLQGVYTADGTTIDLCSPDYISEYTLSWRRDHGLPMYPTATLADLEPDPHTGKVKPMSDEEYHGGNFVTPAPDHLSPYLQELTSVHYRYLKPPEDPQALRKILEEAIAMKDPDVPGKDSNSYLEQGIVGEFVEVVQRAVSAHMKYDLVAESWFSQDAKGNLQLKEGEGDFNQALDSADGLPVDNLLLKRHQGVCRHFAEAFAMLSQTLKEMYPGKFDGLHVVPMPMSYKWHEEVAVYVLQSPTHARMVLYEPQGQGNYGGASMFSFLTTLRARHGIDDATYFRMAGAYAGNDGIETDENLKPFLEEALNAGTPESLEAARLALRHLDSMKRYGTSTTEYKRLEDRVRHDYGSYAVRYQQITGQAVSL